jgi:23S rRNA (cytidine1920-2'-O)/16S rRNA (cytidine1409-2'-O)-methyltransferase
MKARLDALMVQRGLVRTRSQAESYVRLGKVRLNGQVATKPGVFVQPQAEIRVDVATQYVSRAGLKLASVADSLRLDFADKTVLDVGSSTGGFTQFALLNGAKKVIAVDVGTNQLHPTLRSDLHIELHEQTDIREVKHTSAPVDVVLIDVSFISIREILRHLPELISVQTVVVAMVKPQFEVGEQTKHKGVIKNESLRRAVFKEFEAWVKDIYKIRDKADSKVSGEKGNTERFYVLTLLK